MMDLLSPKKHNNHFMLVHGQEILKTMIHFPNHEPCVRDDDDPCFWVYHLEKSIKKSLLYLCVLLFFRRNYPAQQG